MVVVGLIRPLSHLMGHTGLGNAFQLHQGNREELHLFILNNDHDFGKMSALPKLFRSVLTSWEAHADPHRLVHGAGVLY